MNVKEKIRLYKSKMFKNIIRAYDINEEMTTDNIKTPYNYKKTAELYKKRRSEIYGF